MTTATTGTSTMTLGAAKAGYLTFAEAGIANADTVSYVIIDGNDFEMGIGTYTSAGTTLSRDTVLVSKISGTAGTTKLTLSGTAEVFAAPDNNDLAFVDTANTFTATQAFANISASQITALTTALSVANGGTGTTTSTGTGSVVLSASPALTGTPTVPSATRYTTGTQAASVQEVYDTVTNVPENAQTGTTYTFVATDRGKTVTLNNAAAITATIDNSVHTANDRIDVIQYGAGQVTFAAGAGVTIRSFGSRLKLTGQYSGATLWFKSASEVVLVGDITT